MAMATSSQAIPIPAKAEEPQRWSLRSRLLVLLLTLTMGLWVASAILIYFEAVKEGRKLFDDSLGEAGALLLSLAEHEIQEHGPAIGVELMRAESRHSHYTLEFQIWTSDLRSAYRSDAAPQQPFMPLDAAGFGWTSIRGERWRTYATWNDSHTLQIQIAEPLTRSQELSSWTYLHLAVLAMALLPVSLIFIWWILTRSLLPLKRSAEDIAARSPDDLRAVATEDAPSEVSPLLTALNRLFVRVRETLQIERRFTADAAHELRSPLAAIRATAQVMRGARSPQELEQTGADLLASVDRSSRLIDQLLMLARIDAGASSPLETGEVDLAKLVESECQSQHAAAERKGVVLETRLAEARARGEAGLLAVLLRNLIDNAIRYSPPQGHVRVSCATLAGRAQLTVQDEGPGIAPEERERVFERFYRVIGNEATGSGLGLSIVRRIAELHGASIEVQEGLAGRGTTFIVTFPA